MVFRSLARSTSISVNFSTIDSIQAGIRRERETIAQEEARKARLALSDEIQGKAREVAELEAVVKTKDEKLAEAQKSQAELLRKQRELDDAKREFELTIEQRVQEALGGVRDKAKREAEEELKLRLAEREETILSFGACMENWLIVAQGHSGTFSHATQLRFRLTVFIH